MGYLIDTCIWIDVERGLLSPSDVASITGDDPVFLSPITIAELKFGVENAKSPDIRQKRASALVRLKNKPILIIDENTGEFFGDIAATLRKKRGHDFRVQDLWLASQAIQHNFHFLTKNKKDFEDIPGLSLVLCN